MLFDVLVRESEAVLGVLFVFAALLLLGSIGGYLFERSVQPEHFGSVPRALWWAIVTLTTTGYGDTVPLTLYGRMLAGAMMIAGIVTFGMLAGILATGFSLEVRRREFLRNWDLVKQVPIFRDLGPGTVADLAALLRPQELPARTVIWRRGDPGDSMYFIVSGEVDVLMKPPVRIGAGQFFGEMALLQDRARAATVKTTQPCQLLELDIVDFRALASKTPELMRSIEAEASRRLEQMSADLGSV
jgi:voltage-gated potassium channel